MRKRGGYHRIGFCAHNLRNIAPRAVVIVKGKWGLTKRGEGLELYTRTKEEAKDQGGIAEERHKGAMFGLWCRDFGVSIILNKFSKSKLANIITRKM